MSELLLEIGTEEIPSGFIHRALEDLQGLVEKELRNCRIPFEEIKAIGTPRRLVLAITGIASTQEALRVEVIGPARRIAFDDQGQPTRAALGFAKSQGIRVADLVITQTEKGEYICARKEERGDETIHLLPAILPGVITSIPFPKSMRWMDLEISFVRPIHWILALFDGQVVPFQVGNISSGNLSRSHRFMAPGVFQVKNIADYIRRLKNSFVIVNPEERKELILAEATQAAGEVNGRILPDEELLETVTYLVEYPIALRGSYAHEFLDIPREVLISAMREHQRYFTITDAAGDLLPYFVAIANTKPKDPEVVTRGNERVLHARLADAKFFFIEDQKIPLRQRLEGLKKVVYHSKLGTSYEKVMRIAHLAGYLAECLDPAIRETVHQAALLCKADLITGMVGEFPKLQGIMGRIYARLSGEKEEVAQAIYEHYLPGSAGGALPSSDAGAILGMADKLDTIVGCFGVGLIPTGTADPYALRRQTLGIIHIILDRRYFFSLNAAIGCSLDLLAKKIERPVQDIKADVLEFFKGRVQNLFSSRGLSTDAVEAALAASFDDIMDLQERAKALHDLENEADFEPLVIAFKRVVNISRSSSIVEVDCRRFEHPSETILFEAYSQIRQRVLEKTAHKNYFQALKDLSSLRRPVDDFFDNVLVMSDDEKVKVNRLSLLGQIAQLFLKIGDFSKFTAA